METTISFGYWIRRQRRALDLMQQVLAEQVACSLAEIKKTEGDERHVVWALISLGDIEISEGRYKQAQSNYAESLVVGRRIGGKDGIAECLEALATLLATKNYNLAENRDAAKLFGAAETLRESFNIFRESSLRISYDRIVDIVSERLGKTTFETAWAQGKSMTVEQAIALALEE